MHNHMEIIMSPSPEEEVSERVSLIMEPFDEAYHDVEGYGYHGFWDWYELGGRWSGIKLTKSLDEEKLEAFNQAMRDKNVTVSSIQMGKHELSPASQQEMVDALWREHFPESGFDVCPLFRHAGSELPGDVMRLGEVDKENVTASHVMFVDDENRVLFQALDEVWVNTNHLRTEFDGTIRHALELFDKSIWSGITTLTDDWMVVTVDYHS